MYTCVYVTACFFDHVMDVAKLPLPFTVQLPRNAVLAVPETSSRKRKQGEAHIVDFTVTLPSPDETSGAGKVRRTDTTRQRQDKENIESKLKFQCEADDVAYVPPPSQENKADQRKRRQKLRRFISSATTDGSIESDELKLRIQCEAHVRRMMSHMFLQLAKKKFI